jgi:hypothetical protein
MHMPKNAFKEKQLLFIWEQSSVNSNVKILW